MTDLEKLIASVEAGEHQPPLQSDDWDNGPIWMAIPKGTFDGRGLRDILTAYSGSLDAAKRLHDALLPGAFWNMGHLDQPSLGYVCTVAEGHYADSPSWRGYAMVPARAWLLAILRAVQAKG